MLEEPDPERGEGMSEQECLTGKGQCLTDALRWLCGAEISSLCLKIWGLKEQNFEKDQKNMESECSSSERVRNELIPFAGESKLLGRRGGRREVKEYEGYKKLYKIQKINRLLRPHFQIVCWKLHSTRLTCLSCFLPFFFL